MRLMFDAVTAANIPPDARMVAGYADTIKIPQWTQNDWNRFPNAVCVTIVKKASSSWGHVLDVEPGDATPAEAPGWVVMRRKAGADPTVYCNASTWPSVRTAFQNAGVPEPWYWIAKYDDDPRIPDSWITARCVAKQYHGNDPRGFDKSVVLDYWPGVDEKDQPFIPGNGDEDMSVQGNKFKGTTDNPYDYVTIPCDGKRQLFVSVGGTDHVDCHAYYIGNTPGDSRKGRYLGDQALHFDADRPGPVSLPENVRCVTLWITEATHNYTAWCA